MKSRYLAVTICAVVLHVFIVPLNSFSSVTTTYEYNVLDRVGVVGYGSSLTETYTYDANGNRVSVAVSAGEGGMMGMAMKTTTLQESASMKAASSSSSSTLTTTASLTPSASTISSGPSSVTEVSLSTATRETATVPPRGGVD